MTSVAAYGRVGLEMKRICVYCGSSPGSRPEYLAAAREMGRELVERGLGLVYGGARVGTMGALASAMLARDGEVIGVIPQGLLEREVAHRGLADLRVAGSMHERKALMAELSDGFIALPGGLGTLDEFFEILTWAQLSLHHKPCGLLNVLGFYTPLLAFLDHVADQRFMNPEYRSILLMADQPGRLLEQFAAYQPPARDKAQWILDLSAKRPERNG